MSAVYISNEMLVFADEGKPEDPEKKTLGARTGTNNKLNSHVTPGIEPGSCHVYQ